MCRSPRAPTGRTGWPRRRSGSCGTPRSPRSSPAIYEPGDQGKGPPESLYGSLKMWAHLQREGIPVPTRWNGSGPRLARGGAYPACARTTERDPAHNVRPIWCGGGSGCDAEALHVADFTYVPLDGGGFGYTAFVIDAYAGLIAGWECSLTKNTAMIERAMPRRRSLASAGRSPAVRRHDPSQ